MILFGIIFGANLRLMFGTHGMKYFAMALMVGVAFLFAMQQGHWPSALLIALVTVFSFTPGHGSYMDAGQSANPDNEFLAPVMKLLPLRDGSVAYDCVGLGLRYLASTCLIALVMLGANWQFGTHYGLWYAVTGLAVGLVGFVKNWQTKEAVIGAVIFGGLAWAS